MQVDARDVADAQSNARRVDERGERPANRADRGDVLVQPHALHEPRPGIGEDDVHVRCASLPREPIREQRPRITTTNDEDSTCHIPETRQQMPL